MAACWRRWDLAPRPGTSSLATNTLAGMMRSDGTARSRSPLAPGTSERPRLTAFGAGVCWAAGRTPLALKRVIVDRLDRRRWRPRPQCRFVGGGG